MVMFSSGGLRRCGRTRRQGPPHCLLPRNVGADRVKTTYDLCLPLLLAHEGGYSNHPNDPGGPTNFGITIFDYRKSVKPGATAADVRAMTVEEAKRIYRTRYWDAQR